ncbi:MAG: general secretion pathway protein GspH [Betaproteobacteria bacterium HGW-Betaproteobacteria-22]|nr:MAG: general secretion pathway protein GspH [Betaproteobacteria bacterium HGW-Betaproteobacteria-22]
MKLNLHKAQGFSLVEMAVVLVIVGLLIAGLAVPVTAQLDQRNYSDTQKELIALTDALIGFALSNFALNGKPHLPCPDSDNDGLENREVTGLCTNAQGNIPWATLALGKQDSWDQAYIYRVTPAFADSAIGFTLSTVRDIQILDGAGGNPLASNVPAVIVSKGKTGNGAGADETENTNGDAIFVSHNLSNAAGNEFDDLLAWVPASILFNRMVAADRLP